MTSNSSLPHKNVFIRKYIKAYVRYQLEFSTKAFALINIASL